MRPAILLLSACLALVASTAAHAGTPAQVDLEIAGDPQLGAGMSFQQWGRALADAGVKATLRNGIEGDKPSLESGGTAQQPYYKVMGVLGTGDVLILPGARFRRSECKQLAAWLDDLATKGPPEKREKVSAFGLTASQLEKVNADLARPVGFSTQGMARSEAVNKIASQLTLTLTTDGTIAAGDDKIEEELSSLSCGTALACILRPSGFCMVPKISGETLSYTVKKADLDKEVWPVGWPAENATKTLPGIYEFHNVNIANVPVKKVLAAVGKQLEVTVLYDHNAMARYDIDLDKATVTHPQARTTYSVALRRMLAKVEKGGLKFEVRVDEAGKPFLWVSTIKPI